MTRRGCFLATCGAILLVIGVYIGFRVWWNANFYVVESKTYQQPEVRDELVLLDDDLADKNPAFDPTLVDSRSIDGWSVNASAAVVRLDCPMLKPDLREDLELLTLQPSYASAIQSAKRLGTLLPSANMFDGVAKQFDDGLYAALDNAAFRGEFPKIPSAAKFVGQVVEQLPTDSPARPFLGAALELNGSTVELSDEHRRKSNEYLKSFDADRATSTPISFYTWSDELKNIWRFYRFLAREFRADDTEIPRAIADVLAKDENLRQQYDAWIDFYSNLSNPMHCLSVSALIGNTSTLKELAQIHGVTSTTVALFPPATSREIELFDHLFGQEGVPSTANIISLLIKAIQSGQVELQPQSNDGWYQYQVFALETLLLPGRGQEGSKLLLTANYKRRLVEAFKAMLTKRRDTHARQGRFTDAAAKMNGHAKPVELGPRLRVEPCATFYLRTARAYAFLRNFLSASMGNEQLNTLHRLTQEGPVPLPLLEELDKIRERFYGLYLVSCEDIGMRPQFLIDEPVDQAAAMTAAIAWLSELDVDIDLQRDTRVCVVIVVDRRSNQTHLWGTLGVRLAKLDARYVRPPKVRLTENASGDWLEPHGIRLIENHYLIAVDEFAEFILPGSRSMTRDEFRAICDKYETRDAILAKLSESQ